MNYLLFMFGIIYFFLIQLPQSVAAQNQETFPMIYKIQYANEFKIDKIAQYKPKYVYNHSFSYLLSPADIAQIKSVSPNTKVILYRSGVELFNPNGTTDWEYPWESFFANVQTSSADWQDIWQNHKDWLAKNAQGEYIHRQPLWAFKQPGVAYLANIGNAGYQQWLADWVKKRIRDDKFDGVYFDLMYPGYFNGGWTTKPVYNGQTITDDRWKTWQIELITRIRSELKKSQETANGILFLNAVLSVNDFLQQNGAQYLDATKPDAIYLDGWKIWENESEWNQSVTLLQAICQLRFCGIGTHWDDNVTEEESEHLWHFTLSSWLLGNPGNSTIILRTRIGDGSANGKPKFYTWEFFDFLQNVHLGAPQESFTKTNAGLYRRQFASGLVMVNPSSTHKSFLTGRAFTDVFTNQSYTAGSTITLSGRRGIVLVTQQSPTHNPADLTDEDDRPGDEVNVFDYNVLTAGFGTTYDIFDYNILVGRWGE